jgi:site-specific DNA recombinase
MTTYKTKEFLKFGKGMPNRDKTKNKNAVIYTRVSSKEQEANFSLPYQLKICNEYAEKAGYHIYGYFGGTFESAKTDERKEFNRMLTFVKRSKENISTIIVYTEDRFSRTGANAIYIAAELKRQGVMIVAANSPVDTSTPAGTLHQNIKFVFSQFDNEQRRERCMAGTKERLLKGNWTGVVPTGYDQYSRGKEQFITINEKGKILKQAFIWKAEENISNAELAKRLKTLGLIVTENGFRKF